MRVCGALLANVDAVCAAFCCVPLVLYLQAAISLLDTLVLLFFLSFRITGSYVLASVLGKPYRGYDRVLVALVASLFVWHVLAPVAVSKSAATLITVPDATLKGLAPYFIAAYVTIANLVEVSANARPLWIK